MPLSELADIQIVTGPPMISSENGQLRAIVYLNVRGRDMGSAMEDAKVAVSAGLNPSPGYTYSWSGQYEHKIRAQQTLTYIMPIVFLIIFLLLYLHLQGLCRSRGSDALRTLCAHRRAST